MTNYFGTSQIAPGLDAKAAEIEDICAQHGVLLKVVGGVQFHYVQFFETTGQQINQVAANALARMFGCGVPVYPAAHGEMIEVRK